MSEETLDEIFLIIQNAKLEDCVDIMNNQCLEYEGKTMNFHVKKIGKRPPDGYMLYIGLHGGGGTQKVQQFYENHKKLYKLPQGSIWLVPQSPTNSWDHWNQEYIDTMFIKLIQTFLLSNFINPNKVYLTGFSTGGNAVFKLASRMQDVFAAVCVTGGVPKELYLKNFRNTPFSINIGEKDFAFGRNFRIKDFQAKVDKLKSKDKKGYDFLIKSFANQNHWLNLKETFAMNWMATKTRNPYPEFFIWKQTSDILKQFCYYLYVEKPIPDMLIEARQKDNKFEINTKDKVIISVRINENFVDMEEPVKVFYNGKLYFEGMIERDSEFVRQTAYERLDPHFAYWNEVVIKPEEA